MVHGNSHVFGRQRVRELLADCVIFEKLLRQLLNFSEPQFPHALCTLEGYYETEVISFENKRIHTCKALLKHFLLYIIMLVVN